jgi:hypothetical protein
MLDWGEDVNFLLHCCSLGRSKNMNGNGREARRRTYI